MRCLAKVLLLAIFTLLVTEQVVGGERFAAAPTLPNIIIIFTDDQAHARTVGGIPKGTPWKREVR